MCASNQPTSRLLEHIKKLDMWDLFSKTCQMRGYDSCHRFLRNDYLQRSKKETFHPETGQKPFPFWTKYFLHHDRYVKGSLK